MITEKKAPETKGEKMIFNNFNTIVWIESYAKDEPMSISLLERIQQKITEGTLKDEHQSGRMREDSDDIHVVNECGIVVHTPPKKKILDRELQKLFDFANDKDDEKYFFSPIFKAILLHFLIGYLHPFCDGNGRTARAIFYWYLLKKGFVNLGFLPISAEIAKIRTQYDHSFWYTEKENGDVTYSIDLMVKVLKQAVQSFTQYISNEKEKIEEHKDLKEKYFSFDLNIRQIEVLQYFKKYPEEKTSFERHKNLHSISVITARKDLIDLEEKKFLKSKRQGKNRYFYSA